MAEKERSNQLESMWKDIANIVTDNCVNPQTKRPYTVTMIEKAMQDLHLSVNPKRSSKSQALDVIKQLQEKQILPIQRAQMRIRITLPQGKDTKKIREKLQPLITSVEDEDFESGEYELVRLHAIKRIISYGMDMLMYTYRSLLWILANIAKSTSYCKAIRKERGSWKL